MSLADELQKLQALHARGALTDQEYAQAKDALLNGRPDSATGGLVVQTTDWLHGLTRSRRDAIFGGVCGGLVPGVRSPVVHQPEALAREIEPSLALRAGVTC